MVLSRTWADLKNRSIHASFLRQTFIYEVESAFQSLVQFCKKIDIEKFKSIPDCAEILRKNDFRNFLDYCITHDTTLSESAKKTVKDIEAAVEHINLTRFGQEPFTYTDFFIRTVEQVKQYKNRVKRLHKHVSSVKGGLEAIQRHNKFLKEKKDDYLTVLQNVNKGNANNRIVTENDKNTPKHITLAHNEMLSKGIIIGVKEEHRKDAEKYLKYKFRRMDVGVYEIDVIATKFFVSKKIFSEPIRITMLELLEMEKKYQDSLNLEDDLITLNVNLLKNFLSETFKDFGVTD